MHVFHFLQRFIKQLRKRGPDAVIAYQEACTSGTKIIYRSRLMLVGQDRAGKTSLKKALIGLEYVFLHTNNYITSGFH
jgi:GTPase SAR1 family protein